MGKYDTHARQLMRSTLGQDWVEGDESVYSFGDGGGYGQVDGTITGQIAVEFGVGSPKQIRAAILDLVLHPYEAKLLLLVDTPGHYKQAAFLTPSDAQESSSASPPDSEPAQRGQLQDTIKGLISSYEQKADRNVIHLLDSVDDTCSTIPRQVVRTPLATTSSNSQKQGSL